MQDTPSTRCFLIVGGVSFVIACVVLTRTTAPPSENPARVSSAVGTQTPAESGTLDDRSKVSNGGADVSLPSSAIGHLSLAAIKVAVPGASGGVTYLPGTDPAAIQYLARKRAEHAALTYHADSGAVSGPSAPRVSSDEISFISAQKSRP